jgi:type IV pilus assembly protein PilO
MTLRLPKLGQRDAALLIMLAALVVGGLWYLLGIAPMRNQAFENQLQVDTLTQQRDTGLRVRAGLPQIQQEVAQLEAQRVAFFKRLPTQEALASLLNALVEEASGAGIRIGSFNRTPTSQATEAENVRSVNLAMQVDGPFPEVYAYLKRLEEMQRFSILSNLVLGQTTNAQNPSLASGRVEASFTLTFFVLDTSPSAPKTDSRQEKKP